MGGRRASLVERNGWDARRGDDREAIRAYVNGKARDGSNCPPSLVLHLLDILDLLED